MKFELTEKFRNEVAAVAEDRYYPKDREPSEADRIAVANFICGALMYAEITLTASGILLTSYDDRITKLERDIRDVAAVGRLR